MALFRYTARDRFGMPISGRIEGINAGGLRSELEGIGYEVDSVEEDKGFAVFLDEALAKFRRIRWIEITVFTRQLAIMLGSGLTLLHSLAAISRQTRHRKMKTVIEGIARDVERGSSLSEAVEKYPKLFTGMYISMLRAGEAAGIQVEILERLSLLARSESELKAKFRSATIYPVIVIIAAICAVTFILIAVLPKFTAIFEASALELPLPTVILLGISRLFRSFWYVILIITALVALALREWIKTNAGRYRFDRFRLRVPIFGDILLKISLTRFSRVLGSLIRSGVSLLESLKIVEGVVGNYVIAQVVRNARSSITEGQSLSEPFRLSGFIPEMVTRMITVGEETGRMDEMLTDIADFYDSEVDYTIKNLTSSLEPIMLLIMGGMVGFIALSVLLPIFNMVKLFRH